MLFFSVLLAVSLTDFHVSGCDEKCTDKPVFTPSRLAVKYGDSTSATCVACEGDCKVPGLEKSVGDVKANGTTLFWTVDKLTEWDPFPLCYYNTDAGRQCCTKLPVTVYQPPENVSISFVNHTGPMFEHSQYTLQCSVENVAPVGKLVVTFYRGHTALGRQKSNSKPQIKPVSDTFTLNVTISKEDDRSQYWCEAKLELGPEGLQHSPVVTSENITATVYYGPHLQGPAHPDPIIITEGRSLQLNCLAVGNPSPSYTWTVPSHSPLSYNNSILTIESVSFEHKGQYTCRVSSEDRTATVTFSVDVQVDIIPYIIAAVVVAAVLIIFAALMVYHLHYKQNKTGRYNFKDVLRLHRQQAVPLEA